MDLVIKFQRKRKQENADKYKQFVTREPRVLLDSLLQGEDDNSMCLDIMVTSLKQLPNF